MMYHWYSSAPRSRQDTMPSRSRLLVLGAATAVAALLVSGPASAAPVADGTIFTTGWSDGQLYTANATTGELTTVGVSSGASWISGFDIDGTTGVGYAVTYLGDLVGDVYGPAKLFSIDAASGLT